MSGIAGMAATGRCVEVNKMLDRMVHRGRAGRKIVEADGATLGLVWTASQDNSLRTLQEEHSAQDNGSHGRLVEARATADGLLLMRDPLGVAPLYYGRSAGNELCFASEMKGLLEVSRDVHEVPPGWIYDSARKEQYFQLQPKPAQGGAAPKVAAGLRQRLETAVEQRVAGKCIGSWLSGGLDSSALAALARLYARRLFTFSIGLQGAPDLAYAREAAEFIHSEHHEMIVSFRDLLAALPAVIYHLESFDALLVRSSLTNFLVARLASDYVGEVLSGEAGDELFAGYEYLKLLDLARLPEELLEITGRLHNTALQRVDRCASAHGTVAHVPFTDPEVVEYALRIPAPYKIHQGVEKWILRRALDGALPDSVLKRTKAKFWEGAGVGDLMARHAIEQIGDADFARERTLPNGWALDSKEELMYYRIFREHFGVFEDLSWMGRSKAT